MLIDANPHRTAADVVTAADVARAEELRSWLRRATARAEILGHEHADALEDAQRIEAALIAIERRIEGDTLQ